MALSRCVPGIFLWLLSRAQILLTWRLPMAHKIQKPCRICGKMFTPCADCETDKTMFRWKKVACSPECARDYFAKILASRQPVSSADNV